MGLAPLLDIVQSPLPKEGWAESNKKAFEALFGSPGGRYPKQAAKSVTLRAPEMSPEFGVPFAAYIHPSNHRLALIAGFRLSFFRCRTRHA